jgi:hypothetical protein
MRYQQLLDYRRTGKITTFEGETRLWPPDLAVIADIESNAMVEAVSNPGKI